METGCATSPSSQLLDKDSPDDPQTIETIRLLATGEFGTAPTDSDLGRYLPSEHVDRPEGGLSAEDPELSEAGRDASGLPNYIESGKEHMKREIAIAAAGRDEKGLHALGNGLHAVEDYFAHSNFVEVALAQLQAENLLAADNPSLEATRHYAGVDPTKVRTDPKGRPAIVTGTAARGANDKVGTWEALKTEIHNHQFLKVLFRSVLRRPWAAFKTMGKLVLGKLLGAVGGLAGGAFGAASGLVLGAGRGVAAGWSSGRHWWSKPFAARNRRPVHRRGQRARIGRRDRSKDRVGNRRSDRSLPGTGCRAARLSGRDAVRGGHGDRSRHQRRPAWDRPMAHQGHTRDSIGENRGRLPTHSQIAKEDPEHPLHDAATRLARVADRDIGRAMIEVWAGRRPVADAQELVDVYLAHPQAGDWWKRVLLAAVRRARSGSP